MHLFLQFDRDAFFRRRFACGPKKMRASSLGSHNIEIRRFDNVSEKHIIPWCVEKAKELLKDLRFVADKIFVLDPHRIWVALESESVMIDGQIELVSKHKNPLIIASILVFCRLAENLVDSSAKYFRYG